MKKNLDLSIVIVNYNTRVLLEKCLTSIVRSKGLSYYEIFVVDNASTDGSSLLVEKRFPQISIIKNSENLGFSKANNLAIKKTKGRYILLLNPDTYVEKNTLPEMINFMDRHLEAGVATCRVELPSGQLDRDCRRSFPTPWVSFTHFLHLSKIFPKSKIFGRYQMTYKNEDKVEEIDSCVGAFMMVRREAQKEVGLLDEEFFFYGEDLDWCFRFKEKGWKVLYNSKVKIIHYKGASSGMKKTSKNVTSATREAKRKALIASTEAMEIFYRKHYLKKYPKIISFLVFGAIWCLRSLRLARA